MLGEKSQPLIRTNWPSPQDFNESIQCPTITFCDEDLSTSHPELTHLGLPRVASGNFASVYRLQSANSNGEWAVRCFLQKDDGRELRYREIGNTLSSANLKSFVPFKYLSKGIFVNGRWLPILKMNWQTGDDLITYIQANINDKSKLNNLCIRFRSMMEDLERSGLAHGDLQHGNILVADDSLMLVDYDAMYVPAIRGLQSTELGHRNFQHPARSSEHFDERIDNFSAWSIYVSLFCLARDPSLWQSLKGGEECLLFRQSDYEAPLSSPAFSILEGSKDSEIAHHAKILRSFLQGEPDKVPFLGSHIKHLPRMKSLHSRSSHPPKESPLAGVKNTEAYRQLKEQSGSVVRRYITRVLLPNLILAAGGTFYAYIGVLSASKTSLLGLFFAVCGLLVTTGSVWRLCTITMLYALLSKTIGNRDPINCILEVEGTGQTGLLMIEKQVRVTAIAVPNLRTRPCWLVNNIFQLNDRIHNVPVFFGEEGYPVGALIDGTLKLFL